ncbi:hypothetical protein PIB30_093252 [Stylosanthes scabra]|uniref:Uncharacterized protein n=1 Tax=Stylosanthes scabra TaxID=79078 RepID=A0ABU6XVT9_9FABA|nr:hypothetical protein [Stylosanthes scabra]
MLRSHLNPDLLVFDLEIERTLRRARQVRRRIEFENFLHSQTKSLVAENIYVQSSDFDSDFEFERPFARVRPGKMKKGSLQSKKQSLEAKQRKNSTHMRGRARICMLLKDLSTPRQLWPRLGVAPWLPLTTHRCGSPRICVVSQQLTFQSHV